MSSLDNGIVRVGIDLARGATITELAASGGGANVINTHDLGRMVQQSYYAGPDNYGDPAPPWTNFPWNPVGAGDRYGNTATVLEHSNDGTTIYTRTAPLQWALRNVPGECVLEQWLSLDGQTVQARSRLTNDRADRTAYRAYTQELPAVYTNEPYRRLVAYDGDAPYTSAPLSEHTGQPPAWARFAATEHWAALVDDAGFGLGVFNAAATQFLGGFADGPGDAATGYIAPTRDEVLAWNAVYEYAYALVLGTVEEIRAYAVAHRP
ncbi:MAG TPA: hypothetical protein VGN27_03880 [Gaiellaceae bacterium]|nr:hypothetical protein [Gaiellaceae bacterium]